MTDTTRTEEIPAAERDIVARIGRYYEKDGMAADRGEVIGWLLISDPPRQAASRIAEQLHVDREVVDRIADQLVPAGFFQREEGENGDYYLTLDDTAWPRVVQHTFASFPRFHAVMREGLEAFGPDADPQRIRRLANMERLFRHLAAEMPQVWQRYEQSVATA